MAHNNVYLHDMLVCVGLESCCEYSQHRSHRNVNADSWVSTEMCTYYSLNFIFHVSDSAVLKTKQEQKPYINQQTCKHIISENSAELPL